MSGTREKKGSSQAGETEKGGQGRTQGGMLGMGKSRKTVTGDGVEKKKTEVLGRGEMKGLRENKGRREEVAKKTQLRQRLLTDS